VFRAVDPHGAGCRSPVIGNIAILVIVVALAAYLVAALIWPEKF
jgi:K+-transporting ATPase KdpF subunit